MNRFLTRLAYGSYLAIIGLHFEAMDKLRTWLLKRMLNTTAQGLIVRPDVWISGYRNLKVGSNVSINHRCFLSCEGGLTIGNDVSIAHGVSILTTEHSFEDPMVPIKFQPVTTAPVVIGSNVWIGAKATILAGVRIADGVIVAAGAVVTRSIVEENVVVAGVPARLIKPRFSGTAHMTAAMDG